MHFQVVNCPSQVCTLRSTTHTQRERDLSFFLSLNSFFVLLSFSSSAFCCFRRVSSLRLSLWENWFENGIGNGAAHALVHSLSETNRWCVYYVLLNNTGFSVNELRVRLPGGLLRKMYHQSVHRIKRHRPLRETARHHSPRANRLKRSAKETLASEHRGRDSSAPIPNTQKHVDQ